MFVNRRDVQIQWGDCDPANIVYYPRYFAMFDDSTSILFEAAGFSKQDIIKRYGQVLIWSYVSTVTGLSVTGTSSLMHSLLELFYQEDPPEGDIPAKWKRDLGRFQAAYPEFYQNAQSFLTEAHLSSLKLPLTAPDWKRFVKDGSLE